MTTEGVNSEEQDHVGALRAELVSGYTGGFVVRCRPGPVSGARCSLATALSRLVLEGSCAALIAAEEEERVATIFAEDVGWCGCSGGWRRARPDNGGGEDRRQQGDGEDVWAGGANHYIITRPPSTPSTCPVTYEASRDAR